jgi:hypothetical protein
MGAKTTQAAVEGLASKLPEVSRSVACEGTVLEATTFAVWKKNFLGEAVSCADRACL